MRTSRVTAAVAAASAATLALLAGAAPSYGQLGVGFDALGPRGDDSIDLPAWTNPSNPTDVTAGNAGDANGDGLDDVAVLEGNVLYVAFTHGTVPATTVFGSAGSGFRITDARFAAAFIGLPDVNGDGLGEVAVKSHNAITVVFGRTDGQDVSLTAPGNAGFVILNTGPAGASGSGSIQQGVSYLNAGIISAGDQNGDSRPDLAFADNDEVKVAFTPASPAGAAVNADSLGAGGFVLAANPALGGDGPFIDRIGDLDADGRTDLLIAWEDQPDNTYAVAVAGADPGDVIDPLTVAESGTGFELRAPNRDLGGAITLGDQNGDGRRDVALSLYSSTTQRILTLAYSPALGTERQLVPMDPAHGRQNLGAHDEKVFDMGDQDEDGLADIAYDSSVQFTSRGLPGPGDWSNAGGYGHVDTGHTYLGSLNDRNGDGKREYLTMRYGPDRWSIDVFLSAPRPQMSSFAMFAPDNGYIRLEARFRHETTGGSRARGALPILQVRGPGGAIGYREGAIIDANGPAVDVTMSEPVSYMQPGQPYQLRLLLQNGRGLVGATGWIEYGSPQGPRGPFGPPAGCVVPRMIGSKLAQARRQMATSGCYLRTIRPRFGGGKFVRGQSKPPGTVLPGGAGIDLYVGPPKRKRK